MAMKIERTSLTHAVFLNRKHLYTNYICLYRAFSLTWPAPVQIYWNKSVNIRLPQDWFPTPTWPPFHAAVTSCGNAL